MFKSECLDSYQHVKSTNTVAIPATCHPQPPAPSQPPVASKDRMGQMIRSTTSSRIGISSLRSRSAQRCAATSQLDAFTQRKGQGQKRTSETCHAHLVIFTTVIELI